MIADLSPTINRGNTPTSRTFCGWSGEVDKAFVHTNGSYHREDKLIVREGDILLLHYDPVNKRLRIRNAASGSHVVEIPVSHTVLHLHVCLEDECHRVLIRPTTIDQTRLLQ
jgi:hypothetical protein